VLGVIPLLVLSEELQTEFPFWYSVFLGLVFMIIVYFLPRGVTGLVEDAWEASRVATKQLGISDPPLIGPGMGKSLFLWIAFKEALKTFPSIPTWPTWSP